MSRCSANRFTGRFVDIQVAFWSKVFVGTRTFSATAVSLTLIAFLHAVYRNAQDMNLHSICLHVLSDSIRRYVESAAF